MKKNLFSIKGFTLVEALIAVTIVGVIGYILVDIISRSSRTSNKTQLIGVIKQNGQTVLNIMDSTLREADNVICVGNLTATPQTPNSTLVVADNGQLTRFSYTSASATNNSSITKQDLKSNNPRTPGNDYCNYYERTICPTSAADVNYDTPSCFETVGPQNALTSTDLVSGVSVVSLRFDRSQSAGHKEVISIDLKLAPGRDRGTGVENQLGEGDVTFKTTVQLR